MQPPWLATLIAWLIGLSLLVGAVFLAAPVASLVASLFLDEIAAHVEAEVDPFGPPGRAAPFVEATLAALRFFGLSLAVGIVSLILLFVPGVGFVAWLAANAYLLGREYFELAAMRFHSAVQARELRRRHAGVRLRLWRDDRRLRRHPAGQPADAAVRHDADGAAAQAGRAGGLRPRRRPATSPFDDRAISRR